MACELEELSVSSGTTEQQGRSGETLRTLPPAAVHSLIHGSDPRLRWRGMWPGGRDLLRQVV